MSQNAPTTPEGYDLEFHIYCIDEFFQSDPRDKYSHWFLIPAVSILP